MAEEQAEELPRRKGARPIAPPLPEAGNETVGVESGESRGGRTARPTLDDLFGSADSAGEVASAEPADATTGDTETADAEAEALTDPDGANDVVADDDSVEEGDSDELDLTASFKSDEIRDLALAAEGSGAEDEGREVTACPSDADQGETARIVTEAVEAGASPQEIEANEAGAGRNVPPLPPKEPFSTDGVEGRDAEMNQP
jgi:N utilization substance protein A